MFHNISNPKWFGNWSRLEDDYLGNGGTDIADNFTFSKMEKTGGLPLAGNCSGLDIDRILQRPKCLG